MLVATIHHKKTCQKYSLSNFQTIIWKSLYFFLMIVSSVQSLLLATRLMRAHHISSILWKVDLIDSHIGAPKLSMPRRQSMLLVFEFAHLVPFVAPNVVGFSLANPQSTFRIRKVELVQKCQQKNCLRRQNLFMSQNKNLITWCASIFWLKYSRHGHICILVCRMYQICAKHATSVPYFLVLKWKIRGSWPLSLCKVCCSCASFHYWDPDPHENLLIYLLKYNS